MTFAMTPPGSYYNSTPALVKGGEYFWVAFDRPSRAITQIKEATRNCFILKIKALIHLNDVRWQMKSILRARS